MHRVAKPSYGVNPYRGFVSLALLQVRPGAASATARAAAATRRPRAQPALIVALAKRNAARAQDVVGGDGVEMEVWQREREDEGLRREGEPQRADLKVQRPACPAVELVRGKSFQRRFRLADHGMQVGEGDRADRESVG